MTVPWPGFTTQAPPTSPQMLAYLDELGTWLDDQRRGLDRLDQKLQAVGHAQGLQDMVMTLTVWQAVKDRYTDVTKVWDSGRVTEVDLKKLAVMVWSNLNDMLTPGTTLVTGGGLNVTLPEACRMLEALANQLSSRFQLAPVPTEASARFAALLAQVDRIKDQSKLDAPEIRQATATAVDDLAGEVKAMIDKADRGGDVGGIIGPLEVRAARLERDLIVGHAERVQLAQRRAAAKRQTEALTARELAVADLVRRTQARVTPAPKYAVPHVAALGDIPGTADRLEAYLTRLAQVSAALDVVQTANEQAYARRDQVLARLEKSEATRSEPGDPLAAALATQIRELLGRSPAPLAVVEPLLAAYEASGGPA
jgi:hypothetical protein